MDIFLSSVDFKLKSESKFKSAFSLTIIENKLSIFIISFY